LQKLDFAVDGISLARPNNSKPKGVELLMLTTVGHVCQLRKIDYGWPALLDVREDDLLDLGTRVEVTLLIGMRQQHQKNTQLISVAVS
jgi:hypothetical protein